MSKALCVIHANCQGEALYPLLMASPAFTRYFEVSHFLNYTREEIAQGLLGKTTLFLQQYLAPEWGDLSSEELARQLPSYGRHIILPNFFFNGYWPFWTNECDDIEFADIVLESLLAKGLPPEAILFLYLKEDSPLFADMDKNVAASLEKEEIKESRTPIKYLDIVRELWRQEQLFLTVNHPGPRLLLHTANEVLRMLELPLLDARILSSYQHPQNNFWLPIHPAVARRFNLGFADKSRKYPCFGQELTHKQYTQYYIACRKHGVRDLTNILYNIPFLEAAQAEERQNNWEGTS